MAASSAPKPTFETQASQCSSMEERRGFAPLPNPHSRHYLKKKARYSLKTPRTAARIVRGITREVSMYQITLAGLIRIDEKLADWHWPYKAEVSFDLTTVLTTGVPRPFLSTTADKLPNGMPDPGRRHSTNPFPPGYKKDFLRRPDVIIVRNPADRWPGRATADHDGNMHADNLVRVVEMKFPGDMMSQAQERAYLQIAGGRDKFSVLDVTDCGDEEESEESSHATTTQPGNVPHALPLLPPTSTPGSNGGAAPVPVGPQGQQPDDKPASPGGMSPVPNNGASRKLAPVYGYKPLPDPAWYECLGNEAHHLKDEIARAMSRLSAETQAQMQQLMPWLQQQGQWISDKAHEAWTWVDQNGQALARWTTAQLRAAMKAFLRACDLAWEDLKHVQWGQVLLTIGEAVVAVVLFAGAVIVCVLLAEVLAAVLALLGGLLTVMGTAMGGAFAVEALLAQ